MRFSILDRAHSLADASEPTTLRSVIDHAVSVERLGFHRFFVAEHHAVPGIPGSQPAMLATAIAAATSTIRVGTAGIMLPSQPPFLAAEQIGVLEALFPGRIDAGVGNSVGFTKPVRDALRQGDPSDIKERFKDDIVELLAYLGGEGLVTARPQNHNATPVWLLAGFRSLYTAAEVGVRVIAGGPQVTQGSGQEHKALAAYRRNFQPSGNAAEPEAMIALDVAVADTEEDAWNLMLPQIYSTVISRRTGSFEHLIPAQDIDLSDLSATERKRVEEGMAATVTGTPQQVRAELERIIAYTGVDDILVTGGMSDLEGRSRSEELLAEIAAG